MGVKFHYEECRLSDDYLFPKGKPTKSQQLETLEDEGWEIFNICSTTHSSDWVVIVRRPR